MSARYSLMLASALAMMAASALPGRDALQPRRQAPQPKPRDDAERIAKATGKRARKEEKRARQLARSTPPLKGGASE